MVRIADSRTGSSRSSYLMLAFIVGVLVLVAQVI